MGSGFVCQVGTPTSRAVSRLSKPIVTIFGEITIPINLLFQGTQGTIGTHFPFKMATFGVSHMKLPARY